jgi:xanthine/uracil permease
MSGAAGFTTRHWSKCFSGTRIAAAGSVLIAADGAMTVRSDGAAASSASQNVGVLTLMSDRQKYALFIVTCIFAALGLIPPAPITNTQLPTI